MENNLAKQIAAEKALSFIQDGMVVGLGTGSTTAIFIEKLIEKCRAGLKITAIATSERSLQQARAGGIPCIEVNSIQELDIYVDGADEVDPEKRMVKGRGGALLREKIAANMSKEVVIIVDESKLVPHLGRAPLPVEIIPFGFLATLHHLHRLGFQGSLRQTSDGTPYLTDNHNLIYDLHFTHALIERVHAQLIEIPGVVETGFFPSLQGRLIIGFHDGRVVVQ
jgi:ribose 5-phosphate isomerase A